MYHLDYRTSYHSSLLAVLALDIRQLISLFWNIQEAQYKQKKKALMTCNDKKIVELFSCDICNCNSCAKTILFYEAL